MKVRPSIASLVLFLLAGAADARAQSPITSITLGPDQIGVVRTAQGISTRISFGEKVQEVICGDLYDPSSGKGTFVVQNSGSDVFLKPIAPKGMSNLFVKTGDGTRQHVYNFDLTVVPVAQAHRVVNVVDSTPTTAQQGGGGAAAGGDQKMAGDKTVDAAEFERLKADAEQQARQKADEIIRNARQQADRIIAEADTKAADAQHQLTQQAAGEAERRFVQSLMLGLKETRINNTRTTTKKKVVIMLEPRLLIFDDKAYLRYTIQNTGEQDFTFTAIALEVSTGADAHTVPAEITQSKNSNALASGESLTGIIAFDPKQVTAKDKLSLLVRGEDNAELARVIIQ